MEFLTTFINENITVLLIFIILGTMIIGFKQIKSQKQDYDDTITNVIDLRMTLLQMRPIPTDALAIVDDILKTLAPDLEYYEDEINEPKTTPITEEEPETTKSSANPA